MDADLKNCSGMGWFDDHKLKLVHCCFMIIIIHIRLAYLFSRCNLLIENQFLSPRRYAFCCAKVIYFCKYNIGHFDMSQHNVTPLLLCRLVVVYNLLKKIEIYKIPDQKILFIGYWHVIIWTWIINKWFDETSLMSMVVILI